MPVKKENSELEEKAEIGMFTGSLVAKGICNDTKLDTQGECWATWPMNGSEANIDFFL